MTKLTEIAHIREDGSPALPLVIAHGLFGSARNWGAIAKRLSADRPVIAVDMRNHGDSPHIAPHDYPGMAGDLAEVAERNGGQIDLLGHSMGGKAAMQLALTRPDLIRKLVVADIAPVAYAHSHSSHIDAMRGLDLSALDRRSEADARLAAVLPDSGLRAFLLQSLALSDGQGRWKLNLDVLEADMPAIVGWPDTPGTFAGEALFIAGGASDYLPESAQPAIRAQFPQVRFARIDGAGHWLHAEQPRAFVDEVARFLAE